MMALFAVVKSTFSISGSSRSESGPIRDKVVDAVVEVEVEVVLVVVVIFFVVEVVMGLVVVVVDLESSMFPIKLLHKSSSHI